MPDHSFSRQRTQECLLCPGLDGKAGPCDHGKYSRRYVRFVLAHREAFEAMYLSGDPRTSVNEMDRLSTEYRTLPPRHDCSCWPAHCQECLKLSRQRVDRPGAVVIGRTSPVNAPMPMTILLDLNAGLTGSAAA